MILSEGVMCRFGGSRVDFGRGIELDMKPLAAPRCVKNIECAPCTLEFLKSMVVGARVTSAADFGDCLEFGLDQRFNLGLHRDGFHVVSTENPVDEHRL